MGYFSLSGGSEGIRTPTVLGLSKPPPACWATLPGGNGGIRTPNPAGLSRPALPLAYVSLMAETAGFEPARDLTAPTRGLANRDLTRLGLRLLGLADRARPDRACPLSQCHSLSKRSRLPIPAPILLMAEGAGYDPADAVAGATGVRDRRNCSVSAIPPCFLKWRSKRDSHPQEFLTSTGIQSRLLDCFEHCSFMVEKAGFEPALCAS